MKKRPPESGNVLFFILIGVILFAALSYTVGQMLAGGNPAIIKEEKTSLNAQEIVAYGRSLRQAAQNMKISNGCADLGISFETSALSGYVHTPAASSACEIFAESGGGMTYQAPHADWLDTASPAPALRGFWYFPAHTCVPGTGSVAAATDCSTDGTDNEALVALLPYLKKDLCREINDVLGVTNPGGDPPVETGDGWPAGGTKFTGTGTDGVKLDQPRMAGCFEGAAGATPATATYHFFQVLVAR